MTCFSRKCQHCLTYSHRRPDLLFLVLVAYCDTGLGWISLKYGVLDACKASLARGDAHSFCQWFPCVDNYVH